MSKSVGNVYTVKDALKRHSASAIRFYFLSTHYRKDMDLTGLEAAARRLDRLKEKMARLGRGAQLHVGTRPAKPPERFYEAMNDDFNTPLAISILEKNLEEGLRDRNPMRESDTFDSLRAAFRILGVDVVG